MGRAKDWSWGEVPGGRLGKGTRWGPEQPDRVQGMAAIHKEGCKRGFRSQAWDLESGVWSLEAQEQRKRMTPFFMESVQLQGGARDGPSGPAPNPSPQTDPQPLLSGSGVGGWVSRRGRQGLEWAKVRRPRNPGGGK